MSKAMLFDEKNISQKPALELLVSLGYTYISPQEAKKERGKLYNVTLKDILRDQLKELNYFEYKGETLNFSEKNIDQAIADINEPLTNGLIKANEEIYNALMLGKSYQEELPDGSRKSYNIQYIDWETPANNVYHVTDEFSVEREDGQGNCRPDIVLFVNGIPLGMIECKRSSIDVSQGIEQTIGYQYNDAIPHLYKYGQIVMATNKTETMYGTCGTPKKFWGLWREENEEWLQDMLSRHVSHRLPTCQDKSIIALFSPNRLLELTQYFTVYEHNTKIIARYQQFFAVKEIMKTVQKYDTDGRRQGGVIWHTQGSGKSLTMVMLARYLFSEIIDARVVVVTDRKNLDKQIHNTFAHTRLMPARATSGQMLVDLITDSNKDVITTLVHKFDTATKKRALLESKNIFVLVDESHRTQYGELHIKMKQVLPNACYIGFTGTPLMKKEKNTMRKFGLPEPIHTYTIADGVRDRNILPLLYEGRMVEQSVNQKAIDKKLDMITRQLTKEQKEDVKQKWSRFEKVSSSSQRIELIAFDINEHFNNNYKTSDKRFKAMLAVNTKKQAVDYLNAFEELGDLSVAVVISPPDQREGHEEINEEPKEEVIKYWQRMMDKYGSDDKIEDAVKDDFVNGDLDMVIVVDKLLTGFDAPRATVMYIDKEMKEHTLLQAIARVNRLYEGKDYGYIVDYRGLLKNLDEAMQVYSGAGLENFDPKDLKGALYDVKSIIGALREAYSQLVSIFITIKNKNDMEEYAVRLANEELREEFYDCLSAFGRNLAIALESEEIYNALGSEEIDKYKQELKFYQELRKSVKLRYSDGVDHKEYEPKMQKLMDTYVTSDDIVRITKPVDILDDKSFEEELSRLQTPRAKADAIRTRMAKSIETKWDENPIYYKKFSQQIEETLRLYEEMRISEKEYLERMHDIRQNYQKGDSGLAYPDNIRRNKSAQAFYSIIKTVIGVNTNNITDDDIGEISLNVDAIILNHVKVDWYENEDVHNRIEQETEDLLFDFASKKGIDLSLDQIDEIIENVKTIALRRY